MAFENRLRREGEPALVVAVSATMIWLGSGLEPWWPATWFAPLPVLLFARSNSWQRTAAAAILAWMLGGLNLWHYFVGVLHAPPWVWFQIFGGGAVLFAGTVLLFRALLLRGAVWTAVLAFAASWVSFEYLVSGVSVHGTAGSLAYTQLKFLPLLQLASVTGPWGMSFMVLLFPATIAAAWHLWPDKPRKSGVVAGASLGVILAVLIFGAIRLKTSASGPVLKVGLIASDGANARVVAEGAETERLFRQYAERAYQLAAEGAQVIVIPEKLGVLVAPDTKRGDQILQSVADRTKATIVAGVIRMAPPVKYNEARVYSPENAVRSYDKHHMLPPFESMLEPGTALVYWNEGAANRGIAICKDMDFTWPARGYGRANVGLLLVPAWDFDIDRSFHGHVAIMRGVENGFSVARAAKQGYLTLSDSRGRILAEARSDAAPFATLLANVPGGHTTTLYLRWGDWFAWLALGMFAVGLRKL